MKETTILTFYIINVIGACLVFQEFHEIFNSPLLLVVSYWIAIAPTLFITLFKHQDYKTHHNNKTDQYTATITNEQGSYIYRLGS